MDNGGLRPLRLASTLHHKSFILNKESDQIVEKAILNKKYDIAIVGSGPGGGAAALAAAGAGLKTIVIDRKSEVGLPIRCGEAVSEDVLNDHDIKIDSDFVRNYVHGGRFVSSAGRKLEVTTKNRGLILNRDVFEKRLIERARSDGAELAMNTNVTGISKSGLKVKNQMISAKYIIGADGVDSQVGHWAGINTTLAPKDVGICAQYVTSDFEMDSDFVEMYWGKKFTDGGGYVWVFARDDRSANIGIGVPGTQVPADGLKALLEKFIKNRCGGSCKKNDFQVGAIPQSAPMQKTVVNNIILVGDAARLAIPLTGSGIGHALFSGNTAVNVITEKEDKEAGMDHLQLYEQLWRAKLLKKLNRAYKIKEGFRKNPDSIERFFKILKPIAVLHRIFPNFIERVALKDLRY
jgi:digeranylgeranylglycerophospholipid reductase